MEYFTYKKFYEQDRVGALTEMLKDNRIEFEVTEDRESLDSLYGANHFKRQFYVKIKKEDFTKADLILLNESEKLLDTVGSDHYLYEFTDEELFDILSKPDEWNELDYQLAKRLLRERGKEINDEVIGLLRKQRIRELAKPEDGHKSWIYGGYLFAFLGGFLGIFLGWHLYTSKRILPNGQRVFGYSEKDRRHGVRILIISIIMFIATVMFKIATTEY